MAAPLTLLHYAGPEPVRRRSVLYRYWRAIVVLVTTALLVVFVTVRAAILLAGIICVLIGTILLVIGGKRGAAEKLAAWRERTIDLLRLWAADIVRPLRRRRPPIPVVSLAAS